MRERESKTDKQTNRQTEKRQSERKSKTDKQRKDKTRERVKGARMIHRNMTDRETNRPRKER